MQVEISTPEARAEVLNCRVTEANKKFIQQLSKKHNVSESWVVNELVDQCRKNSDSNKSKSKRTN